MVWKRLGAIVIIAFAACTAVTFTAPLTEQPKKENKVYATGHKTPKDIKARIAASYARNHKKLKALPKVTAASYDCRTLGIVPPIVDQGNCGSCWDFSGSSVVCSALIKAGYGKNDGSFMISEQYTLDCYSNGGCSGDDNTTVLTQAKSKGLPITGSDALTYRAYTGSSGRCASTAQTKLYKIDDWGFCTTTNDQGVASTQDIKNQMVAYGPIGAAIAADNAFMNTPPGGVFGGSGSRDINHDIVLCGWDDSKGAWLLRNSWGTGWCDQGYCWIKYGANEVGTEAVWATVASVLPPPAPPQPLPPGPASPITITSPLTVTSQSGQPFSYQITATGSPISYSAANLPDGLTVDAAKGIISGIPTANGTDRVVIVASNATDIGSATLTITVGNVPVPSSNTVTLNIGGVVTVYELFPTGTRVKEAARKNKILEILSAP